MHMAGFILLLTIMTTAGSMLFLWSLFYIVDVKRSPAFYIAPCIGIGCSLILVLARLYTSLVSRILYYIVSIYWGVLIYLFMLSIIFIIINAIHKLSTTWGLCILFIPSGLIFLYGFICSFMLEVNKLDLHIPSARSPVKIVHISDLHLGAIYGKAHVLRIVAEIKKLDPDLVVITGDLLDGSMKLSPDVLFPFNELSADIYFTLGNHDDVFLGIEEVERTLRGSKIILLKDEAVTNGDINMIGVSFRLSHGFLVNKLIEMSATDDMLNILLYHSPALSVEQLEECNIQLHLGGHIHGGQMFPLCCSKLPLLQYTKGLHASSSGRAYVHISEGTGTAGPRLRMFSRSQIILLNIHP